MKCLTKPLIATILIVLLSNASIIESKNSLERSHSKLTKSTRVTANKKSKKTTDEPIGPSVALQPMGAEDPIEDDVDIGIDNTELDRMDLEESQVKELLNKCHKTSSNIFDFLVGLFKGYEKSLDGDIKNLITQQIGGFLDFMLPSSNDQQNNSENSDPCYKDILDRIEANDLAEEDAAVKNIVKKTILIDQLNNDQSYNINEKLMKDLNGKDLKTKPKKQCQKIKEYIEGLDEIPKNLEWVNEIKCEQMPDSYDHTKDTCVQLGLMIKYASVIRALKDPESKKCIKETILNKIREAVIGFGVQKLIEYGIDILKMAFGYVILVPKLIYLVGKIVHNIIKLISENKDYNKAKTNNAKPNLSEADKEKYEKAMAKHYKMYVHYWGKIIGMVIRGAVSTLSGIRRLKMRRRKHLKN